MTLPPASPPVAATGTVVVLGSVNVDLLCSVPRLPNIGETVVGDHVTRQLGGKGANQAVGAARAGARCVLLGAVGDDHDGSAMVDALKSFGVDTSHIRTNAGATGLALVATSREDNQIIVVAGANGTVDAELANSLDIAPGYCCMTQMETPVGAARSLFEQARSAKATTILNAAPATNDALQLLPLCDVLVVNETELFLLADVSDDSSLDDVALLLYFERMALSEDQALVVTMGPQGSAIVSHGAVTRIAGHPATVVDTTGAGDCFCGYLAAGLARGDDLATAAVEANAAASLAVQSLGAAGAIPARSSVLERLGAIATPMIARG